ncbi:ImmA/IrrE family metallo-endopeptidase [Nonomuraea sp. NEAU-A123]|uniref:ImmA/IrrE family metallo-endopeptidase n=1 Tax=Nonomuraea sp. NEAU-A123 TaxID=2839649 RepID=UPI001BE488BE|nr:ImmA/IrrE family metallo-endopeptidase [Nonomuraea sp. NEAU-A123]MBT2234416.1 ImmA/IrrE family metallo-endopeptidase [Nonomuraea sp. NEAU-A123]
MTWGLAHGRAMIRAAQAHRDLDLDQSRYVDVYQALHRAGLMVICTPMSALFGAYLPAAVGSGGRKAGVLLNSHRSVIDQRHSAAHELGHHVFGHGECVSEGSQVFEDNDPGAWPVREKEAEAFAAWFLMPRVATRKVIAALGVEAITRPDEVYQIGLHLGTSYQGTLRHLASLKLISSANARSWARLPRGKVRARAVGRAASSPGNDIWVLGPAAHGATLHVRPGDRLVVSLSSTTDSAAETLSQPAGVRRAISPSGDEAGMLGFELDLDDPLEFDITDQFSAGGPLRHPAAGRLGWEVTLAPVRVPRVGFNEPD